MYGLQVMPHVAPVADTIRLIASPIAAPASGNRTSFAARRVFMVLWVHPLLYTFRIDPGFPCVAI